MFVVFKTKGWWVKFLDCSGVEAEMTNQAQFRRHSAHLRMLFFLFHCETKDQQGSLRPPFTPLPKHIGLAIFADSDVFWEPLQCLAGNEPP